MSQRAPRKPSQWTISAVLVSSASAKLRCSAVAQGGSPERVAEQGIGVGADRVLKTGMKQTQTCSPTTIALALALGLALAMPCRRPTVVMDEDAVDEVIGLNSGPKCNAVSSRAVTR